MRDLAWTHSEHHGRRPPPRACGAPPRRGGGGAPPIGGRVAGTFAVSLPHPGGAGLPPRRSVKRLRVHAEARPVWDDGSRLGSTHAKRGGRSTRARLGAMSASSAGLLLEHQPLARGDVVLLVV